MRKEMNELDSINQMGIVKTGKDHLANKIDNYLVVCIYEQGVRNAEGEERQTLVYKEPKTNSFVVFEKVYRESEEVFHNLRVAARNQMIANIAESIIEVIEKKDVRSRKKTKYNQMQSVSSMMNLIKNETFLAEDKVWEDFCSWLRCHLTEWVLEKMEESVGFERMESLKNSELNQLFYQSISESLSDMAFIARFSDIVDQYAAVWMEEILDALNLKKYSNQQIGKLPGPPKQQKSSPVHVSTDYIQIMNNAAYQYVREALYKRSFKTYQDHRWPTAPLYKGNMEGIVQFRPQFYNNHEKNSNFVDNAWDDAENVSDLDVDVFDALCSIFLSKASHSRDLIEVYFDDLLLMRGLKAKLGGEGRRGGYEPKQRWQILKSLTRIQSLWIELEKAVIYVKGKPVEMKLQGRTFLFKDSRGIECSITELADEKKFFFTVDSIFSRYLYGSGRQIAILPLKTLQYNPYRQTWEKRLSRYVSWRWRTQARKCGYMQPNKIATLLNSIGEAVNQRTPSRTRERLEKALDTLLDDGIINAWYYDEKWDEAIADSKGWSRIWLNAAIIIEPPAIIHEQYQSIQKRKKPKHTPILEMKTMNMVGEQLRMVRSSLHLTLNQVAEELEVSASYISHIECGTKTPSVPIQNKIVKWLQRFM